MQSKGNDRRQKENAERKPWQQQENNIIAFVVSSVPRFSRDLGATITLPFVERMRVK